MNKFTEAQQNIINKTKSPAALGVFTKWHEEMNAVIRRKDDANKKIAKLVGDYGITFAMDRGDLFKLSAEGDLAQHVENWLGNIDTVQGIEKMIVNVMSTLASRKDEDAVAACTRIQLSYATRLLSRIREDIDRIK